MGLQTISIPEYANQLQKDVSLVRNSKDITKVPDVMALACM